MTGRPVVEHLGNFESVRPPKLWAGGIRSPEAGLSAPRLVHTRGASKAPRPCDPGRENVRVVDNLPIVLCRPSTVERATFPASRVLSSAPQIVPFEAVENG